MEVLSATTLSLPFSARPFRRPGITVQDQMNPDARFQAQQQCQQLPWIVFHPSLQTVQQGQWRLIRNQAETEADPAQQHNQPESRADQWSMGPKRAMADQASVGPPKKAERPPAAKSIAAGVEIR